MNWNIGPTTISLVGGGGHATVLREAASLSGMSISGFFDDNSQAAVAGQLPHLGNLDDATRAADPVILAVGDLRVRQRLLPRIEASFASVAHPSSVISKRSSLGLGSFVGAGAIVNPHSSIGGHAIINSRAVVEHHCEVGVNSHLGPGAVLGGHVRVGAHTLIGISASVVPGIHIGSHCIVGAGAVVTEHVPNHSVVVGVPARPLQRHASQAA